MADQREFLKFALMALAEQDLEHAREGDEVWIGDTNVGVVVATYLTSSDTYRVRRPSGETLFAGCHEETVRRLSELYLTPGMEG